MPKTEMYLRSALEMLYPKICHLFYEGDGKLTEVGKLAKKTLVVRLIRRQFEKGGVFVLDREKGTLYLEIDRIKIDLPPDATAEQAKLHLEEQARKMLGKIFPDKELESLPLHFTDTEDQPLFPAK